MGQEQSLHDRGIGYLRVGVRGLPQVSVFEFCAYMHTCTTGHGVCASVCIHAHECICVSRCTFICIHVRVYTHTRLDDFSRYTLCLCACDLSSQVGFSKDPKFS